MLPLLGYASSLVPCGAILMVQRSECEARAGSQQANTNENACASVGTVTECNDHAESLDFCSILCYAISIKDEGGLPTNSNSTFISISIMSKLIPFTPDNCDAPVAFVSPDLPDYIKNVINANWDKTSSGFGDHITVDELISIQDQEFLDEMNEEYANANAW